MNTYVEPVCSKCGISESDSDIGYLIPIEVIVNPGEEGHSQVRMFLCNEDAIPILDTITKLGFVMHHHGSTCLLEDEDCIGAKEYGICPTPWDSDDDFPVNIGQESTKDALREATANHYQKLAEDYLAKADRIREGTEDVG